MTTSYCSSRYCSQCNNTPCVSTKPSSSSHKISVIMKRVFKSMLFCTRKRRKPNTSCSSKSPVESVTVIEDKEDQQPWIVPRGYHKSISISSAGNLWIFRTGWTPQPDPLATLDSGWCSQCHACVKKSLGHCSSCQSEPLILSQRRLS